MSNGSKQEYLTAIRFRYLAANKFEKQAILDEFCTVCGYNRKYAIRLLRGSSWQSSPQQQKSRRGRKTQYHQPELIAFLKALWIAANLACGKRLQAMIPNWLRHYSETLRVALAISESCPALLPRLRIRNALFKQSMLIFERLFGRKTVSPRNNRSIEVSFEIDREMTINCFLNTLKLVKNRHQFWHTFCKR
jgi:hypothetical protein